MLSKQGLKAYPKSPTLFLTKNDFDKNFSKYVDLATLKFISFQFS